MSIPGVQPSGQPDNVQPTLPLLPTDPPKIGDFWLDARLFDTPAGIAYTAHGDDALPVVLVLLSEGAAADAAARDRLAGQVNQLHIDTVVARGGQGQNIGRLAGKFRSEEDDPVDPAHEELAPWVALLNDGTPAPAVEAHRILDEVDLSRLPHKGRPAGPGFVLPWVREPRPGTWRLWPLPWPGRYDRASWITIALSWLLMVLLALVAIMVAILMFQHTPPPSPANPTATVQTPPPNGGGSGSPSSGSGSPQSGSPSPQSASPASGSPQPGTPTNTRL